MMRWLRWLVPAVALLVATTPVMAGELKWETSFASAQARASREHKPVLLLRMFGRLDETFC